MSERTKLGWLKYSWLVNFSKPVHQRRLLKRINGLKARRILQLGVGNGELATRMIDVADRVSAERICYTGVDHFEGATSGGLSLRNAHVLFKSHGAKVKLIPGDVYSALARNANELVDTDVVVIGDVDKSALEASWLYFPRMLHSNSFVVRETIENGSPVMQEVDLKWLNERATQRQVRKAA